MIRRMLALAAVALPVMAASPPGFPPVVLSGPLNGVQAAPPPPPGAFYTGYTAAPVPDQDMEAPNRVVQPDGNGVLTPSLLHAQKKHFQGDGYIQGSTVESDQQKRLKPAPGLNWSVPLE